MGTLSESFWNRRDNLSDEKNPSSAGLFSFVDSISKGGDYMFDTSWEEVMDAMVEAIPFIIVFFLIVMTLV